jgi:hypothetical protein
VQQLQQQPQHGHHHGANHGGMGYGAPHPGEGVLASRVPVLSCAELHCMGVCPAAHDSTVTPACTYIARLQSRDMQGMHTKDP